MEQPQADKNSDNLQSAFDQLALSSEYQNGLQSHEYHSDEYDPQYNPKLDDDKESLTSSRGGSTVKKNITGPLYKTDAKFEDFNLKRKLLDGIYKLGFNVPSYVQASTVPLLITPERRNIIAQSQSGTGKTAAFSMVMLQRVDPNLQYPQAICVVPTLELAVQIGKVIVDMSEYMPEIKVRLVVKGEMLQPTDVITEHVLVGTPGKFIDWSIKNKHFDLKKVKVFVLDEADVMIDLQGHQEQILRLRKLLSADCQILLFSATYEERLRSFATIITPNPIFHLLKKEEESLDNIKQYYSPCPTAEEKYQALTNIYGTVTIGQAIIFCQTRSTAEWLLKKMVQDGHAAVLLTGALEVVERVQTVHEFRQGIHKVLITTNVLARGFDVEQITFVVNFDIPVFRDGQVDYDTYLHRIGRTGRFGNIGIAINLIDGPSDMQLLKNIENHFGKEIAYLNTNDMNELMALDKIYRSLD